jgi:hypothetical protein
MVPTIRGRGRGARPTYRYNGRRFRLTDVHGNVIDKILA